MSACTEEEAKQRWCPFVRVVKTDVTGSEGGDRVWLASNRGEEEPVGGLDCCCVASECMAWQWDGHVDDETGRRWTAPGEGRTPFGFCGLSEPRIVEVRTND